MIPMKDLVAIAERISAVLVERKERIAVVESSAGGLISAALLAVPGASRYFLGGSTVYTRQARRILTSLPETLPAGLRSSSEPYALLLAQDVRDRFSANWGLSETGAAGPRNARGLGNIYGDAAGHTCVAVAGVSDRALTIETASDDRLANMHAFAAAALNLFLKTLTTDNLN
jgi:nicotinamide-nucleotide amidase